MSLARPGAALHCNIRSASSPPPSSVRNAFFAVSVHIVVLKKKITTRVNHSLSSCNIFPSIRVVRVRVPEWPFFLCSVGGAHLRLNSTRSPHDDDLSPALPVDHRHVFGLLQHRHRRRCHWPLRPKHLRHLRVFARQCSAYNGQLHVFEYNQDKGISISCIYICYFISLCTINRGVKVMLKLCDKKKNV